MDSIINTKHSYWKYAEKVNGRLAMMGLLALTFNYLLFGSIIPPIF
jgi:hypothetical protein